MRGFHDATHTGSSLSFIWPNKTVVHSSGGSSTNVSEAESATDGTNWIVQATELRQPCKRCRLESRGIRFLSSYEKSADEGIHVTRCEDNPWIAAVQATRALPPNVKVRDGGVLDYQCVRDELLASHFFVLPTLEENFSHARFEAATSL